MAKELRWVGRTLDVLRDFPEGARKRAGHQLHLVQLGLEPDDWRPMPAVGAGVVELRLHGDTEHRVLYTAAFSEAVYVLHAFEKKASKTPRSDIELGRANYRELRLWRRDQER